MFTDNARVCSCRNTTTSAFVSISCMALVSQIHDAVRVLDIGTLKLELPTGYGKSLCYFALPPVFDRSKHSEDATKGQWSSNA